MPKAKRAEMCNDFNREMKWNFLNQHKQRLEKSKNLRQASGNVENTPQFYITKLEAEPNSHTLTHLRVSLQSEALVWVNTFRELHGLDLILKIIVDFEKKSEYAHAARGGDVCLSLTHSHSLTHSLAAKRRRIRRC